MRYTDMTGQLFRFFHREVLKTISRAEDEAEENLPQEETHTRDIISAYVDTVVSIVTSFPEGAQSHLASSTRSREYLTSLSQMVDCAGNLTYAHTTVFLLLARSKGNVKVG